MFKWLRKETIALLGVFGAAMTVLGQLANVLPFTPWLALALTSWQEALQLLWHPPLHLIGMPLHPHLVSALSLAAFMTMIAIGARVSTRLGSAPLPPLTTARWLDDMSWPSLAVFSALCFVFLIANDPDPANNPLTLFGSRKLGGYAFALIVTPGYIAGDYIGHQEFHRGLYRLAALVTAIVALDTVLQWVTG